MGQFSKIAFFLGVTVFTSQVFAQNTQIQFKTKIIKGTCEFDDNNELNKEIDFNENGMLVASDVNSQPINQPIRTAHFSYNIVCKNYPAGTEKTVKIKSKSAPSTTFNNGIFFGLQDTTKTGFLLESCDKNNQNCQQVNDESITTFPSTTHDAIEINYRVSLVKRDSGVIPGDSNAAVTFEYYQD
ncbi:fimbrial protein [Providencia vermicola]|uniref:fimbrial protein n=1 Tax=Providencia vermicola TaxID=333965 RepID=UPI001CEDC324|nr:hypothetical protein [Providencia vermicola]